MGQMRETVRTRYRRKKKNHQKKKKKKTTGVEEKGEVETARQVNGHL